MISRKPGYYKEFTCIASDCQDNCCMGGWQIGIDEETVAYYQQVEGSFGDELRAAIDCTDEYCFRQKEGKCPLLDENGLCRVYQELGPEHMGVVCDQFPRFSEYYGNVKETGIGMACEEAARIILQSEDFLPEDEPLEEEPYEDGEFDEALYQNICQWRQWLWRTFTSEELALRQKLCLLIAQANKLQEYINENDAAGMDAYLQKLPENLEAVQAWYEVNVREQYATSEDWSEESEADSNEKLEGIWNAYYDLDSLNEQWEALRDEASENHMDHCVEAQYRKELTRLLNYYIFRYVTPVCYDHNVLGAAQFIASNLLILNELWQHAWNGEKDCLVTADFYRVLHVFAREVEYSTDNIETLYEDFLFDSVFEAEELIPLVDRLL